MNLCECGCGASVKKRFIQGHSSRVRKLSDEHKAKIAKGVKEANTPELRAKKAEFQTGRLLSDEIKQKISTSNRGKKRSDEVKKAISQRQLGIPRPHRRGIKASEETRRKQSEAQVKSWLSGRRDIRYSSLETKIAPYLEKEGLLSTALGNKCFIKCEDRTRVPDFFSYKTKQVVEIFGSYWHRDRKMPSGKEHELESYVVEMYNKAGWNCTIVWEGEEYDAFLQKLKDKYPEV